MEKITIFQLPETAHMDGKKILLAITAVYWKGRRQGAQSTGFFSGLYGYVGEGNDTFMICMVEVCKAEDG